ncbi:MAG: hypothetical protein K2G47_02175 [Muribaculum sp.]|nr:hypothetical protein [Muribaculum sp.]
MKQLIIQLIAITLTSIISSSCSSMEDAVIQNPCISNLENTGCISHWDTDNVERHSEVNKGSFEMLFDGQVTRCKFTSLDYPCDYEQVNVKVTYNDGTMTIVEYPSSDTSDCRCNIDASFTIENMPHHDFILKIYHGDTECNYDNATPKYEGRVNQTDGKIIIPY